MRTYISPIGYNSTTVTRPVLSRGIDTGDTVVLLRPGTETDENRAAEAIADVERMLTEIEPEVDTAIEHVTHDDLETAVLECSEVLRGARPDRIVNLGGGARDVLLPFTIAALTHADLVETAMFFSDIDGSVREWTLPNLLAAPSDGALDTLAAIQREGDAVSIPVLTDVKDVSKSTITRHVEELERAGAVATERRGKTKHASITLTGQLLLRGRGLD
ncbi:MAG: CRISPR-associated CARF protein Csa3 [Halodesulfurarchaeum sp.]